MEKLDHIFLLQHVFEIDDIEEVKLIGVFSTLEKAEEVVGKLLIQPGFKNFSKDNFILSRLTIDEYSWKEGFISWEDASN